LLRDTDWANNPLGPVEQWPAELLAAVRTVLNSRLPVLLFWGPELIQLYNDACLANLGDKHPAAVGQSARECWREVWDDLRPAVEEIMQGRETALRFDEQLLFFARAGYLEETYQTYSFSAITDGGGSVLGIFVHNNDAVTAKVIGARRLRTLRRLGSVSTAGAGGAADACRMILDVLAGNRADVPFGSIYLLDGAAEPRLVAAFGFRAGASLPPSLGTDPVAISRVRRAATADEPLLVTGLREQFPGFYQPCGELDQTEPDESMMLPLIEHGRSRRLGVLVLGINPHRPFDADYRAFLQLVADQVSIAVTDALAFQEEHSRAEALTDLDAAKTRFFQNISHELRTPLTLLLAPLGQVLDDPAVSLPAGYRQDLLAARRAALRLQRLVDGLLEVTRGETNRLQPAIETTDLAALTADCASMFRSAVEAAGLTLVVELPDPAPQVPVDRQMWAHIVLNLLSNAVKFTLSGVITVRLALIEESPVLQVSDTGIGIPEEQQPLIFHRFHRVTQPSARTGEGAGIGLSLVADLVHAHGGTVRVDSVPGAGSTFTVTLPPVQAEQSPARPLEPPSEVAAMFLADAAQWQPPAGGDPAGGDPAGSRPPGAQPAGSGQAGAQPAGSGQARNGHILVVDDNADLRDYLVRLLTRDGWAVTPVATVDAALRHPGIPDLVLADVMLPETGGLELLRMIRSMPGSEDIPVMLLTARAGPESIVEGLELGANDYLVKPFEPVELLARVRATVELHRRRESSLTTAEDRATNLEAALGTSRNIGTAVGILMAQRKVPSDRAFDALAAASQASQRKLREVADEVILTGTLPGG